VKARGARVAFEKYSYNGANVLTDFDANNNATARYAMNGVDGLLYVQRGMKKYFYHTNHLGSVVAITDEDGDVVNRYLYTDSWGNFKLSCPSVNKGKPCIPNRYTFTAREWDADLDLYFYRARWYDPDTKRFTQEDPVFESTNKYMYVDNDPTAFVDSFGYSGEKSSLNPVDVVGDYILTPVIDSAKNNNMPVTAEALTVSKDGLKAVSGLLTVAVGIGMAAETGGVAVGLGAAAVIAYGAEETGRNSASFIAGLGKLLNKEKLKKLKEELERKSKKKECKL